MPGLFPFKDLYNPIETLVGAPRQFNRKITFRGVMSPAYCRFYTFDSIG
jgi:hypothetical protein